MNTYAYPDILVDTHWVEEHNLDPGVRLVEVNVNTESYQNGHIEGAIGLSWESQLSDAIRRNIVSRGQFQSLCRKYGLHNDHTLVFYGDKNNWFACYAFWQFRLYGHDESKLRIMNGGRKKWMLEGRKMVNTPTTIYQSSYEAAEEDPSVRAYKQNILPTIGRKSINLIDVRTPLEYSGTPEKVNPLNYASGHIPGAYNIPWTAVVQEDGTFKSKAALVELYYKKDIDPTKPTITYCRMGERSAHSWFALKYLLGLDPVANYDGSWAEWSELLDAPIEHSQP